MTIQYNPQEVEQTLRLLCPGQVTEIRALNATLDGSKYPGTVFGYFDNPAQAAQQLQRIGTATGIYFIPNAIAPAALARSCNHLKLFRQGEVLTGDKDIIERRFWLIDIDAVRVSGVSATPAQKQAASLVAKAVFEFLTQECGFPEPFCGDSGNGYHLLLPLANGVLDPAPYKAALTHLADRFDTPAAKLDLTVCNPARLWKLYGTLACKGSEIPAQGIIHRPSRLLLTPTGMERLEQAAFEQWLTSVSPATATPRPAPALPGATPPATDSFDWLDQWLATYFPEAGQPEPWDAVAGGRIWRMDCPWVPEHGKKARITQHPSGAISAGCFGGRCHDQHWAQLRDLKQPGWRQQALAPQEPWPDPQPVPHATVAPLAPLLLPEVLRPFLEDIAQRMQVPIDFPAVGLIILIGSLLGRQRVVFPNRNSESWWEPANLWGLLVGMPGIKKSPALDAALDFAYSAQVQAKQEHDPVRQQYEADQKVYEAKLKAQGKKLEAAIEKGDATKEAAAQQALEQLLQTPPQKPPLRRYYVQDTTVEKLQEILLENPNGTLLARDEIMAWLKSLEKSGRESDRAFYLEAWTGKRGISVDRIGRGSLQIPSVVLSLVGGIQPGRLREYLQASLEGGSGDDGLIQRFQLLVCPVIGTYVHHDVAADQRAAQQVAHLLATIATLPAAAYAPYRRKEALLGYGFSPDAQSHFNTWYIALQHRLRSGQLPHLALQAHLSKYGSLLAKLALIFHVLDVVSGRLTGAAAYAIQTESTLRAMAWCEYLETHAVHLYGSVKSGAQPSTAEHLVKKLQDGALGPELAVWEIVRKGWRDLQDTKDVELALSLLEDLGWVRRYRDTATQGRPAERVRVHPNVRDFPRVTTNAGGYPTAGLEQLRQHRATATATTFPASDEDSDRMLADCLEWQHTY